MPDTHILLSFQSLTSSSRFPAGCHDKAFNSSLSCTMTPSQTLICTDSSGSISTRQDHLRKNASQNEQTIRLIGHSNVEHIKYNNILLSVLSELWLYKEKLLTDSRLIPCEHRVIVTPMTHHRFWYIDPVPGEEIHILPRPIVCYNNTLSPRLEIQDIFWYTHPAPGTFLPRPMIYHSKYHTGTTYANTNGTAQAVNTTWEVALVISQHAPNSY